MNAVTKNALILFDYALEKNLAGTSYELCEKIGLQQTNISRIRKSKKGEHSFRIEHLHALARLTNANMNWIFGFEKNMFRVKETKKPLQYLQEAVKMLEMERMQKQCK